MRPLLLSLALLLAPVATSLPQATAGASADRSEIDSISALVDNTAGTTEGLRYAEQLMSLSRQKGDDLGYEYGLQQKLNMLCTLGLYDESIAFADSIVAHSDTSVHANRIYFAMFIKAISLIEQSKFRSAIQLAQKQYDDSKRPIFDNLGHDISIRVRCNALMCIGLANNEMSQENEAIAHYTEAINLIPDDDTSNLTLRLDLQTYKMQSAQHISDRAKALEYIRGYDRDISKFRELTESNDIFADLFIDDYALLMQVAYIDVYVDLGRPAEASRHVALADSLMAEYPDLVNHYAAELNSVKSKYYESIGRYGRSIAYADSALAYYKEYNRHNNEIGILKIKLRATHKMGQFGSEYPIAERIMSLSDSMNYQRYTSQVQDMQTIMDVDKLQSEKLLFEQQNETLSAQRQLWIFISVSVLLAAATVFSIFKRRRDKEKQIILNNQKVILEEEVARQTHQLRCQNETIRHNNEVLAENNAKIEKQNAEITDSINYAFRIQQSILPKLDFFHGLGHGGCFAFFMPCHIVSGDFYWARTNGAIDAIVCADCTGHGVPGAFMTMIGTTILNDLFDHATSPTPADMLEDLHENLISILQQSGDENSKDGMDLTIVIFDHKLGKASVASAKRPVYLYRDGERTEIADAMVKRSIGERTYNRENMPFRTVELDVAEGDTLYMSSDGLADLFGGPQRKRFMKKRMLSLMDAIVGLPIEEQHKAVEKTFYDWLTDCGNIPEEEQEQLDDVSFMGVRF